MVKKWKKIYENFNQKWKKWGAMKKKKKKRKKKCKKMRSRQPVEQNCCGNLFDPVTLM